MDDAAIAELGFDIKGLESCARLALCFLSTRRKVSTTYFRRRCIKVSILTGCSRIGV